MYADKNLFAYDLKKRINTLKPILNVLPKFLIKIFYGNHEKKQCIGEKKHGERLQK